MKYRLFRVLGKQEWHVFTSTDKREVEAYAEKYIAQTGSLWLDGTRFEIRTNEVLGFMVNGELKPRPPLVFVV
ncbi:hypothetical protein pf16_146 [Pseudomonas phage pf16]|uniref:Uncharacterized protein n=1 Tax=Pseudomonas phage pf16 TaxID=1815630 RepID=A0A1S5R3T8_9CAUD|nr:hypothetical protein FDG98_gp152 [Pseudomonas phage pf16]AND75069.1 hypothetical protein pf16_146 [Pseudomonas phage pf16]